MDAETTTNESTTTDSGTSDAATTILGGGNEANETTSTEASATETAGAEVTNEATPTTPETYELKAEGAEEADIEATEAFAKEHGLTNEQAQAVLDQNLAKAVSFQEAQDAAFEKQKAEWADAVKADPDLGGDKLDQTIELSRLAMDKFADQSFADMLNETGLGNHPELVRMMSRIGQVMKEGSGANPPAATTTPNSEKTDEELFYGSSD